MQVLVEYRYWQSTAQDDDEMISSGGRKVEMFGDFGNDSLFVAWG